MNCNCYVLVKGQQQMYIDRDTHSDYVRQLARQMGIGTVIIYPTNHDNFSDNRVICDNCEKCKSHSSHY